ncbi:MAG: ParB/RepB/Spo0J family partition protein [Acidobacteria bacterium]|nr:ParB/RepB/Spo0J family partition protein [Acidobacteriota bacterium]
MTDKRKALGRGLRALIPEPVAPLRREPAQEVDLDLLRPNREQPRGIIEDARLDELAASIRSHGIIQPLVVARQEDGKFEIVAGERRWRAAQRAGLLRVPVVERTVANSKRLELALIENIQREDLNAIETAAAYARLADEFGFTQEEIARSVGRDRATVANYQRLLRLPAEVRAEVASGALSMGHARALAGLTDEQAQLEIAREVLARDLSVRETEALVKRRSEPPRPAPEPPPPDVHTRAAEDRLKMVLGTRVRIVRRGKRGRIEIAFVSDDELQRLYEQLTGGA